MNWKTVFGVGVAGFLAIQFIRPAIPHPPVTADLAAPVEVKQILKKSCYDCHSNETSLAWFDEIVPGYWLVANDVKNARRRLNFSEIGALPSAQQKGVLYESVNQVQLGAMPLAAYTRLHRNALVTVAQLATLKSYLHTPETASATPASVLAADDSQYEEWIRAPSAARSVAASPNGIEFPSDYKNWKMINSTDRFDNQTMRVILGNDTAIRAVAENHVNPWPDGTTFAKVAWFARDDGQGHIHAGAFFQVEFMIRDSKKYAATKGWGWARWRGTNLTPYGKDAGFSEECVGCHTPVRNSDYVFTVPLRDRAALAGSLPSNPLEWQVITSFVDKRTSTMSTLCGNDLAVRSARSGSQDYPVGSMLSLVSWSQEEDDHWFGARIPKRVTSVEFVTVQEGPNHQHSYSYEGTPAPVGQSRENRVAYLRSQRAAVLP